MLLSFMAWRSPLTLCMAKRKDKSNGLNPLRLYFGAVHWIHYSPSPLQLVFAACQAAEQSRAPLCASRSVGAAAVARRRGRRRQASQRRLAVPSSGTASPPPPEWERWVANKNAPAGSMTLQMCVTRRSFVMGHVAGRTEGRTHRCLQSGKGLFVTPTPRARPTAPHASDAKRIIE